MVKFLQSKEESTLIELAGKLQQGIAFASPLKVDYPTLLLTVEERSVEPGHTERLIWLTNGFARLQPAPAPARPRQTKH
jgi:hypothetical protein